MYNKPMLLEYIVVGALGLVFGSFAGATVWRLRARQLVSDKAEGETVDVAELRRLKPLTQQTLSKDRSQCLHCAHELAWYDLLPLVSWLSTKGRCRYCHKPIGYFEPLIEIGTAALFVSFYMYWTAVFVPLWPLLVLWGIALVLLVILFAYDAKWFLLPDSMMWPFIAVSALIASVGVLFAANGSEALLDTALAVLVLSGLYLVLWAVSNGEWVGFGDVKLGLGLGLLLGSWQLALLTLFLANLIGTLIVLPGLLTGKLSRKAHIPFGPLLIIGFIISLYFGHAIISVFVGSISTTLMLY